MKSDDIIKAREARKNKNPSFKLVTSPYPISHTVSGDISGEILKYMFPCDGEIVKVLVSFDKKPKEPVRIEFKAERESGSSATAINVDKKNYSISESFKVKSGDKLTVTAYVDDECKVSELWISMLWKPSDNNAVVEKV